ncbi:BTAD domain-containing putative transcriptional regulator [Amycolatopsis magusensis]|uniref:BTAD domain-containing putative transcriptional regulator n=1 Tax=Amycolatopsis magusensis TaxID=882444 RepID=UPI0024A954E5|nr:BTAD domain-containing putative transcriptional regulator [Amycolatopsis magusensis]MDI5977002.1 BTAD domain-containing putative transcriptional regulator [Amycolatopsis magusensis]
MRFGVLGPLAVWTADQRPVKVPEAKVRALLADLLAHRGRPVSADRLVDDLWGAEPPANPIGALQTKVSQLRRALEQAEPGGRELVVSGPSGYALHAPEVDAERFESLLDQARQPGDPRTRASRIGEALALWRGAAFADFPDADFLAPVVQRLDELRLVAFEEQAEARLELGEHSELAGELADLVARHPLRERLRRAHLLALYRAGRQSEALAGYAELRERLADELGLDPSPELAELYQSMLRQDPALTPSARRTTNLPAPLTELIGRDGEATEVGHLLGANRLVTLAGPGGVGKTRLAIEAASRLTGEFPDGVWLVELAGHWTHGAPEAACSVAEVTASMLNLRENAVAGALPSPSEQLAEALRDQQLLLVLDNCEHLVEPVAELVQSLLLASPGLRVLTTSQEPLGLAGEVVYGVRPLELPSAVELFSRRAAAVAPGFALSDENTDAVAEICRRLDGIPLALELAASRIRVLGAGELLSRLDDRFRVLTSGHRGAPARQQTLRAMIGWSWELLTEAERIVLRRLALHVEGCDLEAAEAVCAGEGVKPAEVLDLLARLVDRSLVAVTETHGRTRYRLLESVSAYCVERLHEVGEFDCVRRRHNRYYLRLAERGEPQLCGSEQRAWLDRLDSESANFRAALEGAELDGDAELAIRLVNALGWYWFLRGRLREGHRSVNAALAIDGHAPDAAWATAMAWQAGLMGLIGEGPGLHERAEKVLALYDDIDDPLGRARAEWFMSFALIGSGDLSLGAARVDRALAGFRALGDRWGEAAALSLQAMQARPRGGLAQAKRDSERAIELFREVGDRWGEVKSTDTLSSLAEIAGDYERAESLHRNALRLAEELGLWNEVSYTLSGIGRIALLKGEFAKADEYHERARKLSAQHSHKRGEQFAEIGLGLSARRQGRYAQAEVHLERWLDWCRQVDGDLGTALLLAELGFAAEQRGDTELALARQREGFAAASATGDPRSIALAMEGLAGATAAVGDHRQAARLLGAAAATRDSVGTPLPEAERGDVDRVTAAVVATLGEAGFAEEFDRGRTDPSFVDIQG